MNNEKLNALKEKLNELVKNNAQYEEIYKISKEIDKYIVEYYMQQA